MPAQPAGLQSATILFTDLVGSTAKRAEIGEEAAEALRRAHDRLLLQAVQAHNGTVAKHVRCPLAGQNPGVPYMRTPE